jgi:hypothetical protein
VTTISPSSTGKTGSAPADIREFSGGQPRATYPFPTPAEVEADLLEFFGGERGAVYPFPTSAEIQADLLEFFGGGEDPPFVKPRRRPDLRPILRAEPPRLLLGVLPQVVLVSAIFGDQGFHP